MMQRSMQESLELKHVDYDRIGERMYVEMIDVEYDPASGADRYVELVKKAAGRRKSPDP